MICGSPLLARVVVDVLTALARDDMSSKLPYISNLVMMSGESQIWESQCDGQL